MALSKKHYEQFAQSIRNQLALAADYRDMAKNGAALPERLNDTAHNVTNTARRFMLDAAAIFEADSARFDRERFVKACGF